MTDCAPRFRHLGGDRWEWTPQRVLDQRERQARLLDAMARSDMVSLRAQAALHELWGCAFRLKTASPFGSLVGAAASDLFWK